MIGKSTNLFFGTDVLASTAQITIRSTQSDPLNPIMS